MGALWVVFAAVLCVLGKIGSAAASEPCDLEPIGAVLPGLPMSPIIENIPGAGVPYDIDAIEEVLPSGPPVGSPCVPLAVAGPCVPPIANPPCDADGKPLPLPTPLSFALPVPAAPPAASIFSILSQAQNSDNPSAVLAQITKFLASTLPNSQLQAAAGTTPQEPCDAALVTPPVPNPLPCVSNPLPCVANPPPPVTSLLPPVTNPLPSLTNPLPPIWNPLPPANILQHPIQSLRPIVPSPSIPSSVSYLAPPPSVLAPPPCVLAPAPPAELIPLDSTSAGCGQSSEGLPLATLAMLQQQANLGLTALSPDVQAQINAALPVSPPVHVEPPPSTAPPPCPASEPAPGTPPFDIPSFGYATSKYLNPWSRMFDPIRRLYPYRSY